MKQFMKKILTLLLCVPVVAAADVQKPQQNTLSATQITLQQSDPQTEQFRLALQYLGALFVKTVQLVPGHSNLLPDDLLDVFSRMQPNQPLPALKTPISPFALDDLSKATLYKNFQGLEKIPLSDGIFYPQNTADVVTLINFARTHQLHIRTMGARHSPPTAINDPVSAQQMLINLDGDLRKIHAITPDPSGDFAIVSVGAGCNLGVNVADPRSTLQNSFDYQIDQAGYALPTLGGISHQTIAGFLQTSSSGGTAQHGIADAVEAIEWVNGKGEIRTAKRGDPEFNAVVVSMGMFGIVTNVTFKVIKSYWVAGSEANHELADSYLAKDANGHYTALHNALFQDNEYIHINWLAQKYVNRTMQWTGKAVPVNSGPIVPYKHTLNNDFMANLATIVFRIGNLIDEYAVNVDLLMKLKAEIFKLFCNPNDKPQEFRDVWYRTLPIDDQADVDGKVKTLFSEMWFPEDKLDEVMQRLETLVQNNPKAAGNFIIELYCAKESPYWLSPAFGHKAFRVDLYWWNRNIGDPTTYFGMFWQALLDIPGARLHWGKFIPIPGVKYGDVTFTSADLYQKNYPKWNDWLALREQNDPQQIFVTDYWRQVFAIPQLASKQFKQKTPV